MRNLILAALIAVGGVGCDHSPRRAVVVSTENGVWAADQSGDVERMMIGDRYDNPFPSAIVVGDSVMIMAQWTNRDTYSYRFWSADSARVSTDSATHKCPCDTTGGVE